MDNPFIWISFVWSRFDTMQSIQHGQVVTLPELILLFRSQCYPLTWVFTVFITQSKQRGCWCISKPGVEAESVISNTKNTKFVKRHVAVASTAFCCSAPILQADLCWLVPFLRFLFPLDLKENIWLNWTCFYRPDVFPVLLLLLYITPTGST